MWAKHIWEPEMVIFSGHYHCKCNMHLAQMRYDTWKHYKTVNQDNFTAPVRSSNEKQKII